MYIGDNMNLELFEEFQIYHIQYSSAIFKLLDNNPDVMNMILPLTNLIYQKIENDIKLYISEPHISTKTFRDLKIDNHHLNKLIDREELKKYYEDIDICEKYFDEYKKSVLYFYKILGEDSFINSRYPIEIKNNLITNKRNVDYDELYQKWTEHCLATEKMTYMYMAYCSSNTLILLKRQGKINGEIEENMYINNIIEHSFSEFTNINLDEDKKIIFELMKNYIKRRKYFDDRYVC